MSKRPFTNDMSGNVVAVAFQNAFYFEMYQNDIFYV
jgi:hypothetical protein